MSTNFDFRNAIEAVSIEELEKLHTGSLLKRLEILRSLQNSFEVSDWLPEERDAVEAAGLIAFKESDLWKSAFSDVKELLADREHLPRGSKEKRREAARQKRNR